MPMLTDRLVHSLLGRARWSVAVVAMAVAGLSCGEAVVAPAVVKEVGVSGGGNPLRLAQSAQLGVALRGEGGVALPSVGVSWTSSDASVATVSASGQVTAVKRGTATISASAGGVTGTAAVPVIGVQRVDATPDSVAVIITQAAQLAATVTADPGVTVTPSWVSRDTALATVTAAGRVTAKSALGVTWVVATAEDQRDSVKVRVIPVPVASVAVTPAAWTLVAGQTVQLLATTKDSVGGLLTGRVITWTSSDTARAVVGSGGLVTTKAAGAVTITATSEGKSAGAALTVLPPVSQVTLSVDTLTLILGKTGTLVAAPKAADGTTLDRAVSWSVLDTTVATVATDGVVSTNALVTARKVGSTTVTATSEGKSKSATLRVIPAPVVSVAVTPATATLVMGKTLQLSAVPKDAEGNALGGRTITWTSSAPALATVSAAGLVTAISTGVLTVTATSEEKTGTAELTIQIPVATVTVTPPTASLLAGQTVQLSAVAKDSLGNTLPREILWSSSNGLIASVNATGLVTATGSGTATILATSEGVTGTATVTAAGGGTTSGGTVAAIAALPSTLALVSGDTGSFAFRPTDASGAVVVQPAGTSFVTGPVTTSQTQVTSGTLSCGTSGICTQRLSTQGVPSGAPAVAVPLRVVPQNGGAEGSVTAVVVGTVADSLVGSFVPASVTGVPSVAVGDTVTIRATLFTAAGAGVASNARFSLQTGTATLASCMVGWGTGQVQGGCVKVVPSQAGTVRVIASLPRLGGSASWADTVELSAGTAQVRTITLDPATVTLGAGQSATLTATLKDDFNATLTGRIVTWTSSDPAIATVSTTGSVTGVKPGTTTVLAQSGGKLATATVTVVSAFEMRGQSLAIGGDAWIGHTCAIAANGTAFCWGSNSQGQLGDGSNVDRQSPAEVAGSVQFSTIVAGVNHTCGIDRSGAAWCWGGGGPGVLGNGSQNSSQIPTLVSGGHTFLSLSSGRDHMCGLTVARKVVCWGGNWAGGLGNGKAAWQQNGQDNSAHETTPFMIPGLEFKSVAASSYSTCAVTTAGDTYCWGQNWAGELGIGTTSQYETTPKLVLGGLKFDVVAGSGVQGQTFCGQGESGVIYCWGANWQGQYGTDRNSSSIPRASFISGVKIRSISIGSNHTCGVADDGNAYCWGQNPLGLLGTASPAENYTPTAVPGISSTAVIVAGVYHTCAISTAGALRCWGQNFDGQLGNGSSTSRAIPDQILSDPGLTVVSASFHKFCGLSTSGRAHCWGEANQEIRDIPNLAPTPTEISAALSFASLSAGGDFACGVQSGGQGWCWGNGWNGQLGSGSSNGSGTPTRVSTADALSLIAAGGYHACGITTAGKTLCWGNNQNGELGQGNTTLQRSLVPVAVNTTLVFTTLTSGRHHTCGLIADGSAYCWGSNGSGQLGDGTTTARSVPTAVVLGLKFTRISASGEMTCAITAAGKAYCWGTGWAGQLGNGGQSNFTSPSPVNSTETFSRIATMSDHACGINTAGTAFCWGSNSRGQLGSSAVPVGQQANSPVVVGGGRTYSSISGHDAGTCAVGTDGKTYCWGSNQYARLTASPIAPTTVAGGRTYRTSR